MTREVFPHNELTIPLARLDHDQIRVLILHPGAVGSPLSASIALVRLQPEDLSGAYHDSTSTFERTAYDQPGDGPHKYIKVGELLHKTPLDYNGDGSEIASPQVHEPSGTLDYEAISYTWGEPVYFHAIMLEGHGNLRITESLHAALQRFRQPDTTRKLWADAICIDQADNLERSAQVNMMDKVYQQAREVLVWLGPSEATDSLAFAALEIPRFDDVPSLECNALWQSLDSRLRDIGSCTCCSDTTFFLTCGTHISHMPTGIHDDEDIGEDLTGGWGNSKNWPDDPNAVREHYMLLSATKDGPPDKSRVIAQISQDVKGGQEDYCWVPPDAQTGDRVCIVAGASFPFVLRELPNGCYALLGDAFVYATTLKQALGGGGQSRWEMELDEYYEPEGEFGPSDNWRADDRAMQELIAGMGWITLQ